MRRTSKKNRGEKQSSTSRSERPSGRGPSLEEEYEVESEAAVEAMAPAAVLACATDELPADDELLLARLAARQSALSQFSGLATRGAL